MSADAWPANLGHCCGGSWCMGGNCACDHSPRCCTYVASCREQERATAVNKIGFAAIRKNAQRMTTEQTEAQDDEFCTIKPVGCPGHISEPRDWCAFCKLATAKAEAVMFAEKVLDVRLERDALRAQLEAARELAVDRRDVTTMIDLHQVKVNELFAQLQEHQDALSEMRGRMEGAERELIDAENKLDSVYPRTSTWRQCAETHPIADGAMYCMRVRHHFGRHRDRNGEWPEAPSAGAV